MYDNAHLTGVRYMFERLLRNVAVMYLYIPTIRSGPYTRVQSCDRTLPRITTFAISELEYSTHTGLVLSF